MKRDGGSAGIAGVYGPVTFQALIFLTGLFFSLHLRLVASLVAGLVVRLFALEKFRDELFELAAGVRGAEAAFLVEDEDAGNGIDAPLLGEVALPAFALVILGPADLVLLDERLERVEPALGLGLVQADAEELHALVLVLGVQLLHVRHLRDAGPAPGGPEVNDHDLPLQVLDRNLFAADGVGERQIERLADRVELAEGALGHRRHLRIRVLLDDPAR